MLQTKQKMALVITISLVFTSLMLWSLYLYWIKNTDKIVEDPNKIEYQPGDVVETIVHNGYFIINYPRELNKVKDYVAFSTVVCQDVVISETIIHRKVDKKVLLEAPKVCTFITE